MPEQILIQFFGIGEVVFDRLINCTLNGNSFLFFKKWLFENIRIFFINYWILIPVEVISEDSVLKWYREAHSPKGKMHFLEKMRPFIEWLANAEEGKH